MSTSRFLSATVLFVLLGLGALVVTDHVTSGASGGHPPPLATVRRSLQRPADVLVKKMRALGLDGSDWHRPPAGGPWEAELSRTTGGIEVTCRLFSYQETTLETVEVELERYARRPSAKAEKLVEVFHAAILAVAPGLPGEYLERNVPWQHPAGELRRVRDTGSREVLRFTRGTGAADDD